ncbi:hypothetical protein BMF94_6459 [Rhodotorula taiwanensis]|uniref:5-formyltetrahydrofolate cyclo-ligase n=1 Tax=Rhodotorula taiwanensis TaxID=741276 RepID=A0A2S5B1C6_9BASI|nr:hypothetical protein BMF94_6459 [Rhodotorula taiwanensis]
MASWTGASTVTVQQAKKQLRTRIASRLKRIPSDSVHAQCWNSANSLGHPHAAEAVLARLFASPYWTSARSISCFLSLPHSEIQTDSLIRHALRDGKRIYVPFCPVDDKTVMRMVRLTDLDHFERLEANRWGIREVDPKEVESLEDDSDPEGGLDLLIVPGLAFDPYRRRLGHGRGYYDRYINQYCLDYPRRFEGKKAPPRTVALALREQMVQADEEIPTNEWDRLPDSLITPDGIYE